MKIKNLILLAGITIFAGSVQATIQNNNQSYPYAIDNLQAQYHNWLLVNDSAGKPNSNYTDLLVHGGLSTDDAKLKDNYFITSEGLGFQVLLSAGMLNLPVSTNPKLLDERANAKAAIAAVYKFIYTPNPDVVGSTNKLVNGLLPWAWWMNKTDNTVSVAKKGSDIQDYSATDGDIFLVEGFYRASLLLESADPKTSEDYKNAALEMMHAILKWDTAFGDNTPPYYLNGGGDNKSSTHTKMDGLAYSKTPFSFLTDFAKWDTGNANKWNAIISNTLNVMYEAQSDAKTRNSNWGAVLGFTNQTAPGGCICNT